MSTLTVQTANPATPQVKALDETVWRNWNSRNRRQERRRLRTRVMAANWIALFVTVVAALVWSPLAPFETAIRFVICGGAIVLLFRAIREREYGAATVFGVIAVLFNPVLPLVGFSGAWQRAVVAASAIPFLASLARARKQRAIGYYDYD